VARRHHRKSNQGKENPGILQLHEDEMLVQEFILRAPCQILGEGKGAG